MKQQTPTLPVVLARGADRRNALGARTAWRIAALLLASASAFAQTASPAPDASGWRYTVTPYLWASALGGEASFKGLPPQPVEMSFGDIWEDLDFAVLAAFEAHNGRWGVGTDVVFMNLGAKIPLPDVLGQREPGVDTRQLMWELDGFYRVHQGPPRGGARPFVDLIVGGRYNRVSAQLETSVLPDTKRPFDWVDGVVGARFLAPLRSRVALTGRADIAGFGSDFTWQAIAGLRFRLSEHWTLGAGYRYVDTDYDSGSGSDRKLWSMVNKGPYFGAQIGW
jgi:opacity protein-like surface antigen